MQTALRQIAVRCFTVAVAWTLSCSAAVFAQTTLAKTTLAPPGVDYAQDIRPLLLAHCVQCHGARKQEAGLRLDAHQLLMRGGDNGPSVVAGKPDQSRLIHALRGQNDITRMPAEAEALAEKEIRLFEQWVLSGATIPVGFKEETIVNESDHWSFQPIARRAPPSMPGMQNAIDGFVWRKLAAVGLSASPAADRATLIRRLSFDLLGLPPAVDEVTQFVADDRPDAWDRLVDRTLASPRYGERWARHWLDAARYADSNGFTIDGPRSIWKYRDWVVEALNRDLPFDQFATEQLAGDLLPNATTDQTIATGFHRNTLINEEGGTDQEQFRVEAINDRVATTGTVFLGLTLGCARCHTHKFDPITQREYFEVFSIFNSCDEPTLNVPSSQQSKQLTETKAELAAAQKPLAEYDERLLKGLPAWVSAIANGGADATNAWTVMPPSRLDSEKGALLTKQDDDSVFVDFSIPPRDTFIVECEPGADPITAIRLEALTHPSLPNKGPGRADNGNFVLNEVEVLVTPGDGSKPTSVKLTKAIADHSQDGYPIAHAIDGNVKTGWAINVKTGSPNVDREAVFFPAKPLTLADGAKLTIRLVHQHDANNYLLGRFRLSTSQMPASALAVPAPIRKIASLPAEKWTDAQRTQVTSAYKATDPGRVELSNQVDRLRAELARLEKSIPTTMVLKERTKPRETFVHIRGDFLRPGDRVTANVPAVLPPLGETDGPITRLNFARWLVDAKNPLTARVSVNRFWQRFFGTGIVNTENDFGTQGSLPTHPELLDWLASEFQAQAWSMKSMHRIILTSATYRQSSHQTPELLKADQGNRWLARQSRIRLEAEAIRDTGLAACGLLSDRMGGAGVYPPQPEGIYVLTQVKKSWPESTGDDRYRRGLYTYLWRSSLYPMLPVFDAPDATTSCTRRSRSNTPLQALTLANDRAFIEMARALGRRILTSGPDYDEGRIRYAFQISLSREPEDSELDRLMKYVTRQRITFASHEADAKQLVADAFPDAPVVEAATWTSAARVLLNLDEFITRE